VFQILDKVFSYLGVKDLAQARLVSRHWNERATRGLRGKHETIHFYEYEEVKEEGDDGLEKFLEVMRSSTSIPYTKFRYFCDNELSKDPTFIEFLELVRPTVLSLG